MPNRNQHIAALAAAAAAALVTVDAMPTRAGILFQDDFENSPATSFTIAQQLANPALQGDFDPINTTGAAGATQPGQWFHYAKSTTPGMNIQVTNNIDFPYTGTYQGSNVLRMRRSAEPPASTGAMGAYIGPQSSGIVRASWMMMFPATHTLPFEPFGITFPAHVFFTPYADNDHSEGTSPDGMRTPIIVLDTPQPPAGAPQSWARYYQGGFPFSSGGGSVELNNPAAGDPVVTRAQWQQWAIEANIDTNTYTLTVDGISKGPIPFNFPGGFSAFTIRVAEAQAPLDPTITGTIFIDDMRVERLDPTWNVNASGNWTDPANWLRGVPNGVGAGADFTGAIQQPQTITVDAPITVGLMTFDNPNTYTITGANPLTIDAATGAQPSITVLNGSHTISAPVQFVDSTTINVANASSVLTFSGANTFAGGTDLIKNGQGRLDMRGPSAANIVINGGALRLVPDGTVAGRGYAITVPIAGGASPTASLDLTNNAFVIDYQTDSPINVVLTQIQSAYAAGAWTGNGIKTTQGAGYGVGYGEIGEFGTVPPIFGLTNATMVLLRGTLYGDSDLNGTVNIGDFSALAANFNLGGTWSKGDFNYDGAVGIADFSLLAANFNLSVAATAGRSTVPEPAAAGVLVIAGLAGLGRPRRG